MTLRELMGAVRDASKDTRIIKITGLLNQNSPVAASVKMGEDIEITAYENGYVSYQKGEWVTVFPLHRCAAYIERDVCGEEHFLAFDVFADQPWQIRVFLEGENRLLHNKAAYRKSIGLLSIDYSDGRYYLSDKSRDPFVMMMKREDVKQECMTLYMALDTLTETQRYVVIQRVVNGKRQREIASEMGTSIKNISDMMQRALRRLRKYYCCYARRKND